MSLSLPAQPPIHVHIHFAEMSIVVARCCIKFDLYLMPIVL